MSAKYGRAVFLVVLLFLPHPSAAEDLQSYLSRYFSGNAIRFGYGSGVSSSSPRVELVIHYCASGAFFSSGRSCRPNVVARGYQCTPLQDAGRWQLAARGGQAVIQWLSNSGNRGELAIAVRGDGIVVDPRGNPFDRVGRARCR